MIVYLVLHVERSRKLKSYKRKRTHVVAGSFSLIADVLLASRNSFQGKTLRDAKRVAAVDFSDHVSYGGPRS